MASLQLSAPARVASSSLQRRRRSPSVPRVFLSNSSVGCLKGRIFKSISPKMSVSMCLNQHGTSAPSFEANTSLKYSEDQPEQFTDETVKPLPTIEPVDGNLQLNVHDLDKDASQQKKGAKIHDFCFGIPFGGVVFGGGLVGFLLSRSSASLVTGVLPGGAILALAVFSLKVWKNGKSSLPFILGQAVIAATVLWKRFQLYSSTKKLIPSGFYILISAAMLCFYSYVLISGGNPPPKKKLAATPAAL